MALLDSEIAAIKRHLGYNLLTLASEPYINHAAVFEQVIQPYIQSGATTTSSTSVDAETSYTRTSLTLASGTGFTAGCRIVVDVDSRQEIATVQSISGSVVSVLLKNIHDGTYPVTVEGGETIVRKILRTLESVEQGIDKATKTAGLKRAEDIEWFPSGSDGGSVFSQLQEQLGFWRKELARALGLGDEGGGGSGSSSSSFEVY